MGVSLGLLGWRVLTECLCHELPFELDVNVAIRKAVDFAFTIGIRTDYDPARFKMGNICRFISYTYHPFGHWQTS